MKPAETNEAGGRKALAYNRATQVVVHGFGDKDMHLIGAILAANGHYALDMRDIASMGILDPKGKKYHRDDWKSNDGVGKDVTQHWVTVWAHTTKALLKNVILAMDPLVAWGKIQHCEYAVKFLGGKRAKPRGGHGVITFAMGRSPVGGGSWEARSLTAHLDVAPGVVPGKQQGMEVANVLQDEVIRRLGIAETEAQYTGSGVGVSYHAWLASAKHAASRASLGT
jgi:hypothetical protein